MSNHFTLFDEEEGMPRFTARFRIGTMEEGLENICYLCEGPDGSSIQLPEAFRGSGSVFFKDGCQISEGSDYLFHLRFLIGPGFMVRVYYDEVEKLMKVSLPTDPAARPYINWCRHEHDADGNYTKSVRTPEAYFNPQAITQGQKEELTQGLVRTCLG